MRVVAPPAAGTLAPPRPLRSAGTPARDGDKAALRTPPDRLPAPGEDAPRPSPSPTPLRLPGPSIVNPPVGGAASLPPPPPQRKGGGSPRRASIDAPLVWRKAGDTSGDGPPPSGGRGTSGLRAPRPPLPPPPAEAVDTGIGDASDGSRPLDGRGSGRLASRLGPTGSSAVWPPPVVAPDDGGIGVYRDVGPRPGDGDVGARRPEAGAEMRPPLANDSRSCEAARRKSASSFLALLSGLKLPRSDAAEVVPAALVASAPPPPPSSPRRWRFASRGADDDVECARGGS